MSDIILKGAVHKYGANVNTDEIIPARYLNSSDPQVLAKYCMEDIDKDFVKKVKKGDIIAAGNNFGCGSSREHAPIAIKASGISAVIANSFARIFFRNAINIGLPILESPQAVKAVKNGDKIEINLNKGIIKNLTRKEEYQSRPFPEFMQKIIKAGGLLGYIKK
jgi:3-isopropylmalate/(R)-2-methylmalate dehydratase small subunit